MPYGSALSPVQLRVGNRQRRTLGTISGSGGAGGSLCKKKLWKQLYNIFRKANYFLSTYFENGTFQRTVQETTELIAPYVQQDPNAFCSYEDYQLAVETINWFCLLRAESVRGQLNGLIPSTIRGQAEDKISVPDDRDGDADDSDDRDDSDDDSDSDDNDDSDDDGDSHDNDDSDENDGSDEDDDD